MQRTTIPYYEGMIARTKESIRESLRELYPHLPEMNERFIRDQLSGHFLYQLMTLQLTEFQYFAEQVKLILEDKDSSEEDRAEAKAALNARIEALLQRAKLVTTEPATLPV